MDSQEGTDMSAIGDWEAYMAQRAISEAVTAGVTLEGLQDALTRRIAAQRLSPPQEALDRAYNPVRSVPNGEHCFMCGHPTGGPHIVHECSSEG